MISYKDMTFCSAVCFNVSCHRNMANLDREHVEKVGLGIAVADFSTACDEYTPLAKEDNDSEKK